MNDTKKFTLTLDEQQINYLMGVLQKQTLGDAISVFLSINQQVQTQINAPANDEPASAT